MNQAEMLHQMCHDVLSEADVKAICKSRELPRQAAASRSLLESLFLSDTGVAAALATLDRTEVALLHLLKAVGKPVDIAFFSRMNPPNKSERSYGTFTQRFQGAFSKVRERLVRKGVLILALGPEGFTKKTNMERWQFLLPGQFARHLPPLLDRVKRLSGEGDWQSGVAREKLKTAVDPRAAAKAGGDKLEIVERELRLGREPFRAARLLKWQTDRWQAESTPASRRKTDAPYTLLPADAVVHLLGGLDVGDWCDVDSLDEPLGVFCREKADSRAVCESGWRWGCLARQRLEGKMWYRLAPRLPDAEVRPDDYLAVSPDGSLVADLNTIGLESLEKLVMISDQRPAPGARPALLITPNLVKLGRAGDAIASLPLAEWLRKNSPAFRQAFGTLKHRRGKTILHENLSVARVGDLALKVAIEKALGERVVSLGEDFIAFPCDATAEVKRVVAKSGHVIKEVSGHEA